MSEHRKSQDEKKAKKAAPKKTTRGSGSAKKPAARAKKAPARSRSKKAPAAVEEPEIIEAEEEEETSPALFGLEEAEEAEVVGEEPAARPPAPLPIEDEVHEEEDGSQTVAVSRTDPLARYMQEVSRHPVLSREEEHELAVRYQKTGDLDAAYRLVASNLRLVVKIAYEYRRAAFNVLDLIQEGNVGLMNAVKKYDPFRGVKLSTYAAWWIRAYILRFVMDNWRMVKLGTTQAQRKLFFNLRKEQQKLAAEGFEPGPRLLAERLQVSEREVEEMEQRLSGDELSIDMPMGGEEGGASWGDRLALPAPSIDEELADAEIKRVLREELEAFGKTLEDEKERFIFEKRMTSDEPLTLQQIGNEFGFSRERARQIEARLVKRLRERMRERLPDFDALAPEE